MPRSTPDALCAFPRRPLSVGICALLALTAPATVSAQWVVNNCDEGSFGDQTAKTGTLRFAAEHAASGNHIDMSSLVCPGSKIMLLTGSIDFAQNSITLLGPGSTALTIDASEMSPGATGDFRVLNHGGSGTLTVYDLGLSGGHVYHTGAAQASKGGCLYSSGSVELDHVDVTQCLATSSMGAARGAGIYATVDLTMKHSILSGNDASSPAAALGGGMFSAGTLTARYSVVSGNGVTSSGDSRGGGLYATGYLRVTYSSIAGNAASGSPAAAAGGGIAAAGTVSIFATTISGNSSSGKAAGVFEHSDVSSDIQFGLTASTVSGNTAGTVVGGVYTNAHAAFVENSTIAFNSAAAGKIASAYFAPGLVDTATGYSASIEIASSILSNNRYGPTENDVSVDAAVSVSGQYNIVRVAKTVDFLDPPSTACPLLGPLRDNGGLAMTHALLSGSPAIDHGNTGDSTSFDERGPKVLNGTFDYFREAGPLAVPDIGAYEVQDEIIFNTGVDGCL